MFIVDDPLKTFPPSYDSFGVRPAEPSLRISATNHPEKQGNVTYGYHFVFWQGAKTPQDCEQRVNRSMVIELESKKSMATLFEPWMCVCAFECIFWVPRKAIECPPSIQTHFRASRTHCFRIQVAAGDPCSVYALDALARGAPSSHEEAWAGVLEAPALNAWGSSGWQVLTDAETMRRDVFLPCPALPCFICDFRGGLVCLMSRRAEYFQGIQPLSRIMASSIILPLSRIGV